MLDIQAPVRILRRMSEEFVLKQVCYYSDMARPIDQEMVAIEKLICFSQFSREGGIPYHGGKSYMRHQDQSGGRESERGMWARTLCLHKKNG